MKYSTGINQNVSQRQMSHVFGDPAQQPSSDMALGEGFSTASMEGNAPMLASRDQPVDTGWADRDLDPTIQSSDDLNKASLSAITSHSASTGITKPVEDVFKV